MLEPPPHPERGKGYHKSCPQVPGGGILEANIGVSNGDRVVYRSCHGRGGPLQSVRHTETLVLACVHAVDQPPLDGYGKVRRVFHTLYQREKPHPPVLPLGTRVKPTNVNNEIPLEADIKAFVRRLRLHRSGGHTHLCVEHFKKCQREAYPGER